MKLKMTNHKSLGQMIVFAFLLLFGISTAQAATYYVSPTGSDTNPGTLAEPFQTIGHTCSGLLNPGDTVIVEDGIYTSPIDVCDIYESGSSSGWITFESEHKWGAKLNGNNNASAIGFDFGAKAFIRVKNFEIYGFSLAGINIENEPSTTPSSNIEIIGNNIHDIGRMCLDDVNGRDGIFVGSYSSSVLIDKNLIHNIGRYAPGENGCSPTTQTYMNHDHGIYLDGVIGVTIINNILYSNDRGWDIQIYGDRSLPLTSNALIANNTFASQNPYRVGQVLLTTPGVTNAVIENNIFYSPPTAGVIVNSSATFSNVTVNNNIINGGGINSGTATGVTFLNNMGNTNPNLINASQYDFHLQNPSPAINAGVSVPRVTEDFSGNARPSGAVYDIGAYEYTGPTFYGSGLGADSNAYTTIGGPLGQKVSYRFLSTHTGPLSSISWYQVVNSSGYTSGTNGQIQVQIQTDDGTAAHNPSGTVLASAVLSSLCNGTVTGCAVTLPFLSPASLQNGTLYHVVLSNIDPSPASNYSSVSALYNPSPDQPSVSGTSGAELMYTQSAGWIQQTGFNPIIQFNFSDGATTGQAYVLPYTQWIQNISGQNSVREQFTVSAANQQINSVSFRLALWSGNDPLTISLEQSDGTILEQGTISASAVPSNIEFNPFIGKTWAVPQWVTYNFISLHTLSVGQSYYLVLSAPATSIYNIYPIQKGGPSGFSTATDFPDGYAQFNNGSGWTGGPLTGSNANTSDLQFYLTMRPTPVGTYNLNVSTAGSGFGMVFGSDDIINCGINPGATLCNAMVFGGTAVTLTATPANGSTFTGWAISGSSAGTCTGKTSPCMLTVNANTNVNVNFCIQTDAITASAGTGGMISPSGLVNVNYGASQLFTITPNAGYNATLTVDGSPAILTNNTYTFSDVTTAHTIAVNFSLQTEAITVIAGSNGSITPTSTVITYGGSQTFTLTPNTGYTAQLTVDGTAVALSNNTYTLTNVTTTHTVAASFSLQTEAITASAGTGGTISPSGTVSVNYGASQLFTITPNAGYNATLTVDGSPATLTNNTYTFSNVTTAHTIAVIFSLQTETITVTAGTGGTINPSGTLQINYGASQTFTVTPITGYSAKLKIDGSVVTLSNNMYTLTDVTAPHKVTVSFSLIAETIKASAGSGGTISPTGTVKVNYGANQTFTVTPNTGYNLTLKVDGSVVTLNNNTYTFTDVTTTHIIVASFSLQTETITASAGTGGTISPSGAVKVNYGASKTFTVTPKTGYTAQLTVDGTAVALSNNTYILTNVTTPHTVVASFNLKS